MFFTVREIKFQLACDKINFPPPTFDSIIRGITRCTDNARKSGSRSKTWNMRHSNRRPGKATESLRGLAHAPHTPMTSSSMVRTTTHQHHHQPPNTHHHHPQLTSLYLCVLLCCVLHSKLDRLTPLSPLRRHSVARTQVQG